jgi:hypothetical protein
VWINRDIRRRGAACQWVATLAASAANIPCALLLKPPQHQGQELWGLQEPMPRPSWRHMAADACLWWGDFSISSVVYPSSLCLFLVLLVCILLLCSSRNFNIQVLLVCILLLWSSRNFNIHSNVHNFCWWNACLFAKHVIDHMFVCSLVHHRKYQSNRLMLNMWRFVDVQFDYIGLLLSDGFV